MSTLGINQVDNKDNMQVAASNDGSNNRIGNVLANGNAGESQYVVDKEQDEKIDPKAREEHIKQYYANDHAGVTVETFYDHAKLNYNLDKDAFLNLPKKLFEQYVNEIQTLIETKMDDISTNSKDGKQSLETMQAASDAGASFEMSAEIAKQASGEKVENIDALVQEANKAKEEGLTTENAVKVSKIIGKSLVEIINQCCSKQIKSLDELSKSELKEIIKKLSKEFLPSKNDDLKTQLEKNDTYRYLFRCLAQQKDSDLEKIYNAFKEVSAEMNTTINSVLSTIDGLKNKSPKELKQLIETGAIEKIMVQCGITDKNTIDKVLEKYSNLLNKEGITTQDILKELNNDLDIDTIKRSNTTTLAIDTIDCLKGKSKEEKIALLKDNSIQNILIQSGMSKEEAMKAADDIAKQIINSDDTEANAIIFKYLVNGFSWENMIAKIKNKDEKDRTEQDNQYLRIDQIKQDIKNGTCSKEDEEYYNKYGKQLENELLQRIKELKNIAAAAGIKQDNKLAEVAKNEYADSFNDILKELAIYINNDPNAKIDIEYLDSISDGLFSKVTEEYKATISQEKAQSEADNSNNSYGYTTNPETEYTTAVNNVATLTSRLYVPEEEGYTVESMPAKSQNKKNQPDVSQKTAASNGKYFDAAWAEGKIDIKYLAENFSTACGKGIQKVWNFLDRNQQNRLDYLNSWRNAELSSDAAKRYDMDDEEIEALDLSIGETQVLKNRHKQLHQHEEDKG